MKTLFSIFLIMVIYTCALAQPVQLTFSSGNSEDAIDSVVVVNQRTGQVLKLSGNETLVLRNVPTGSGFILENADDGFIYPNPTDGFAFLNYFNSEEGDLEVKVYNSLGNLLGRYKNFMQQGNHQFRVTFPVTGMYILSVKSGHTIHNFKAIYQGTSNRVLQINYQGTTGQATEKVFVLKSFNENPAMDFREGDILYVTLYSGDKITVFTESPTGSGNIDIDFYECKDQDNRYYKAVTIGDQIWMAENLAYLPAVSPSTEGLPTAPYYYVYGYEGTEVAEAKKEDHFSTYGVLYNWPAAMTACPAGWHLPSDTEWKQLEKTLGMTQTLADATGFRGTNEGSQLKMASGWSNDGNGTNTSGFSALPGGIRESDTFGYAGGFGYWWSSTEISPGAVSFLRPAFRHLYAGSEKVYRFYDQYVYGISVRCIRDDDQFDLPSVNTTVMTEITPTSAKSGAEISGLSGPQIFDKGLVWGKSELPSVLQYEGKIMDATDQNTFTTLIEGLSPNTIYYVRAYVVCGRGVVYGNQQSFTTSELPAPVYGQLTDDRGGETKIYKTVIIGDQTWMAENLAYLPSVSPSSQGSETVPYCYVYDYQGTDLAVARQHASFKTYGVLYNWPAAMAGAAGSSTNPSKVQGACPAGWHLPSHAEWEQLENYLSRNGYRYDGSIGYWGGGKIAKSMAATALWGLAEGTGAIGNNLSSNNKSGFSALPGGFRTTYGSFARVGFDGFWYSSTEYNNKEVWTRNLYSDREDIFHGSPNKATGFSVRCVKD